MNFETPPLWPTVPLGQLARDMCLGKMLDKQKNRGTLQPYLRNVNVRWFSFSMDDLKDMRFEEQDDERFGLLPGDLVVCEGGEPGRAAVWRGQAVGVKIQKALHRIRFHNDEYDPYFAMYFLYYATATNRLVNYYTGTTIKHLTGAALSKVPFPAPPLPEQRRIVAKIEELFSDLDAGVAALERAKGNLKRYRAAVLKAAVEGKLTEQWRADHPDAEPASQLLQRILTERRQKWEADQLAKFAAANKTPPKNWREKYPEPTPPDTTNLPTLPENWCWVRLDQILTYLRNGYFQSPSGAVSGTPILRISAVRPMKVDLSEVRFLETSDAEIEDYFVENTDLLFTRYNGSVDLLGVAGMVRGCMERTLHPDKLIRVKVAVGEPLPSYVEIAVNVGVSRKHIAGRARTTAGQTGISGPDIRDTPIPLPPLYEQTEIVAEIAERLSQIETAESVANRGLARAARLRQSILKQAFEGKLVPQDPRDEPASVLLERLRTTPPTSDDPTPAKPRRRQSKASPPTGRTDP